MKNPRLSLSQRWLIFARLLFAGSVPLLAWAFGVVFLLVPSQTVDLLADPSWLQIIAFHVGVASWAISCWFWTRWSFNLQPVVWPETLVSPTAMHKEELTEPALGVLAPNCRIASPGRGLREWIARVPLLIFPLVALIPIWRSPHSDVSLLKNLAVLVVVAILLVWFAIRRGKERTEGAAAGRLAVLRSDQDRELTPYPTNGRMTRRQCFERLPFGRYSYLIWILGFALLCIAVWCVPVSIPAAFGAPAIAFIGLAAATGVIAFFIILLGRISGVPGLGTPIVLLWAIALANVSQNHAIRTIGPDGRDMAVTHGDSDPLVAGRPKMVAALDAWLSSCVRNTQEPLIVIVATAGGASRAALWTASVLHQAEQVIGVQRFRQALFGLSGVSGGSLGAAVYVASMPSEGCAMQPDQRVEEERWEHVRRTLSATYLAPPIAAYLSTDLLARIIPIAPPDRAAALEQSWEEAFVGNSTLLPTYAPPGPAPAHATGLQDSFLSLWQGDKLGRFPLLFLNGTHADTGLPIVTAPVQMTKDQFPLALDLLDLVGRDVRFSTAVSNSARFPVVTPGGTLLDHHRHECAPADSGWLSWIHYAGRRVLLGLFSDEACNKRAVYGGYVMDGGYVENFGADTVRDLVADIDAWRRQKLKAADGREFNPHVLVIQISSDPSLGVDVVARCRDRLDDKPLTLRSIEKPPQAISDVLGPLLTVAEARGARGARSAGDLMRTKCRSLAGTGEAEYVHFALCDQPIDGQEAKDVVGLNWALTRRAVAYLAGDAEGGNNNRLPEAMNACNNAQQLMALKTWFDKIIAHGAPAPP